MVAQHAPVRVKVAVLAWYHLFTFLLDMASFGAFVAGLLNVHTRPFYASPLALFDFMIVTLMMTLNFWIANHYKRHL